MKIVAHICTNHPYTERLSLAVDMVNLVTPDVQHVVFLPFEKAIPGHQNLQKSKCQIFIPNNSSQFIIQYLLELGPSYIVIHGLFMQWQLEVLFSFHGRAKLSWSVWGGDLYQRLKSPAGLNLLKLICDRLDFVSCPLGEARILSAIGGREIERQLIHYPVPTLGIRAKPCDTPARKFVIIGNSGDPSNNHLDIVRVLAAKRDAMDYEYIIPFSYNGDLSYRSELCDLIAASGIDATIRDDFIAPPEYAWLLSKASYLITAHNRQQAWGNISTAICSGTPIAMRHYITIPENNLIENPLWGLLREFNVMPVAFEDMTQSETVGACFAKFQCTPASARLIERCYTVTGTAHDLINMFH